MIRVSEVIKQHVKGLSALCGGGIHLQGDGACCLLLTDLRAHPGLGAGRAGQEPEEISMDPPFSEEA